MADKLSKIFIVRQQFQMFARTELVATEAERGQPYDAGIDEAIQDPLSGGQEAIPDAVHAKPSDIDGSEPEHCHGSELMHSDT
ncbi:hypothetical protein Ddye_000503 [Dipteronia dyeriana]|uniref:Uncharacterized protein n=1 Tax=Dipteronia dyeriana TaxID=168575 RepID=A0AAE0CSN7_9ROSI|nr:hypothetical protein Ddye_000503 [Dipteronia dyeriana]